MGFTPAFHSWIDDPGSEAIRRWIEEETRFLKEHVGWGRVLDVGVGNGRILKLFLGGELYGIDNDPRMVQIAKINVPSAHIVYGDARHLPFPSNFFDYTLCVNNTLGNIRLGKIRVLREMNRVLKPGGEAIVSVYADSEYTLRERLDPIATWGYASE